MKKAKKKKDSKAENHTNMIQSQEQEVCYPRSSTWLLLVCPNKAEQRNMPVRQDEYPLSSRPWFWMDLQWKSLVLTNKNWSKQTNKNQGSRWNGGES